jgi:hypothetical protein
MIDPRATSTEKALKLGRAVTFADLLAVHPGRPQRCLCRGTGRVHLVVNGQKAERECGAAMAAFREKCGARCIDTDKGPHWKLGQSPEEWSRFLIFMADAREFDWRQRQSIFARPR